jgi:DNA-binding NarL/FixJ family response regulator
VKTSDGLRVLVVDDNPVIRMGLRGLLDLNGGVADVQEASNGREAIDMCREYRPDLVLLDVRMPVMDGLTALESLAPMATVIVLTHAEEPDTVKQAMAAGARGYLVHDSITEQQITAAVQACRDGGVVLSGVAADVLIGRAAGNGQAPDPAGKATAADSALRAAGSEPARRGPHAAQPDVSALPGAHLLSAREREIMEAIATGRSNADIASEFFLSEKTVKNHINRIYVKLGFRTRSEAIAAWLRASRGGSTGEPTGSAGTVPTDVGIPRSSGSSAAAVGSGIPRAARPAVPRPSGLTGPRPSGSPHPR